MNYGEYFGTLGGNAIKFLQYIFIPTFFLIFATGIVLFLMARKNPTKKRRGYLFTTFGAIGVLLITYGPVFFVYYSTVSPVDTHGFLTASIPLPPVFYKVFKALVEPILLFLTYFGVAYLLLAAKEPFRKRMGLILLIGSPVVWLIMYFAPDFFPVLKS